MNTLAWLDRAQQIQPDLVSLRRAIHAEPEIGLQTPLTTKKVIAALHGLPLELRRGPSTTGLVAILRGSANGRTVLLRGDMDALPMQEETGLPYASRTDGRMHACGHDSHTSMLVGAARLLCARRDQLAGTVMFMFQPGEEGWHGARHMIEDGLLDPLPDAAFALHVQPTSPFGQVAGRPGPLLASADVLRIRVDGRGGHAAMPHEAVDPIPVACEIVTAIQAYVTRRVKVADPAVVTIAKIEAGSTDNVIPSTAHLLGTMRTLSADTRAQVQQGLRILVEHIALAHGATAELEVELGFPVTVCDPRAVGLGQQVTAGLFGDAAWLSMASPVMGAEDFSYVLEQVPGAMFFLGAAPPDEEPVGRPALHNTRMTIDETVMAHGAALHAAIAERFLTDGFAS